MISSVLTVCIGNVCRSPMAEGLLRQQLPGVVVASAGLGALVGEPAEPHAVELMAERGVDIAGHRARQLNGALCTQAELILVMDSGQKKEIESRYPVTKGRVFLVCNEDGADIFDPYRLKRLDFERCLDLIARGTDGWARRISSI